jgi:hypothetical protein
MKSTIIYLKGMIGIALLLIIVSSCTKNNNETFDTQSDFSSSTLLQVYQATLNASRNYVYVDANQLTGALMVSGSVFPSTGYASVISPGLKTILVRDTLAATTQVPLSFGANMQTGKHYTIFAYDTITTPKQKTVETNIVIPADSAARLRFANFVFSRTAVPPVDIFSKRRGINIFTNVPVTDVTGFIRVPSSFNDTLIVRETGTLTQLAILNGINPTQKRSYTIVLRGRYTNTTGAAAMTLSSFANY